MTEQLLERRNFLKMLGMGTASLGAATMIPPTVIAKTKDGQIVESEEEYGKFRVEQLDHDSPYQYDPDVLKPMSEKNTVSSRNLWDPIRQNRPELTESLSKDRLVDGKGKVPNQTRLDYALMASSWALSAMRKREKQYEWDTQTGIVKYMLGRLDRWNPADINMSWEDTTVAVKHAALFHGASLAGVAELNPLWLYSDHYHHYYEAYGKEKNKNTSLPVLQDGDRYERTDDAWYIPKSMNRVISLAFEEDFHGIENSPGRLASAATGNGYSRMSITSYFLAEFIRGLGYRALPAGNQVGLSIPIAIDAGLGELGRNGLLITPKYGPRVRLAKVITDMPLIPDKKIKFGVPEFCEVCMLCATHCPSGSISKEKRTWKGPSPSNSHGTYKWYVKPEPCYDYNGFSCSNCKRVCPFNKPNDSWLHETIRKIIDGRIGPLNKAMVSLDQAGGYGEQIQDTEFWKMDGSKCITAREKM